MDRYRMATRELTDEEVFGAPSNSVKELTDEEVFGIAPKTQPNESSFIKENIARPLVRAAKTGAKGLTQVLEPLSVPIGQAMDYGASKLGYNTNFGASPSEAIGRTFDEATNGLTVPRDSTERVVDKAGEFVASGGGAAKIAGLLAGKAGQFARQITPQNAKQLFATATAGLGAGTANEIAPDNPYAEIAGALAGGIAASPLGVAKGIAGLPSKAIEVAGRRIGNKPDVIRAAASEGIELPPSAMTDNKALQFAESRVSQSSMAGQAYKEKIDNMNEQFINAYKSVLDNVGETNYANSQGAGLALQDKLSKARKLSQSQVGQNYEKFISAYGQSKTTPKNTLDYIEQTAQKLEKTAVPSPSKTTVLDKLKAVSENFSNKEGVDVETLLNTKNDLNDIINYDVQGGTKQYLKGVVSNIKKDIQGLGNKNPNLVRDFTSAEESAKVNAKNFRNKLVDSMLKNERPEAVISSLNAPSDVAKLNTVAAIDTKLAPIVQEVKRLRIQQILDSKLIDATSDTPNIKPGTFSSALAEENIKQNELIKSLAGQENYNRLKNLATIAKGIASSRKNYNFSNTSNVAQDVGTVVTGLGGLAYGSMPAVMSSALPYLTSKIITSKSLTNGLTRAVKAQASNSEQVRKNAAIVLTQELMRQIPQQQNQ